MQPISSSHALFKAWCIAGCLCHLCVLSFKACDNNLDKAAAAQVSSSDVNPAKKAASTEAAANGDAGGNIEVEDTSTVDAGAKFD